MNARDSRATPTPLAQMSRAVIYANATKAIRATVSFITTSTNARPEPTTATKMPLVQTIRLEVLPVHVTMGTAATALYVTTSTNARRV